MGEFEGAELPQELQEVQGAKPGFIFPRYEPRISIMDPIWQILIMLVLIFWIPNWGILDSSDSGSQFLKASAFSDSSPNSFRLQGSWRFGVRAR